MSLTLAEQRRAKDPSVTLPSMGSNTKIGILFEFWTFFRIKIWSVSDKSCLCAIKKVHSNSPMQYIMINFVCEFTTAQLRKRESKTSK
jgi:hypothetical protein